MTGKIDFAASYANPEINKDDQIQAPTGSKIKAKIRNIAKCIAAPIIFPSAKGVSQSRKLKHYINQTQEGRDSLKTIGGIDLTLQTPDGDKIEAMHLDASKFRDIVLDNYDVKEKTTEEEDDKVDVRVKELVLKVDKKEEDSTLAEALRLLGCRRSTSSSGNPSRVFQKHLENHATAMDAKIKISEDKSSSKPTVIICPANAAYGSDYKKLAMYYLQRGINVLLFNYRGHGKSTGIPTDDKLKLDAETCYQYLKSRGVDNKDIIVHGHCLGGGVASHLAASHKNVNLYLDRSFSRISTFLSVSFPRIKKFFSNLFRRCEKRYVSFNNIKNIKKVSGNIALQIGTKDDVISTDQIDKLTHSIFQSQTSEDSKKTMRLIISQTKHVGIWYNSDIDASTAFDSFLDKCGLSRNNFPPSP